MQYDEEYWLKDYLVFEPKISATTGAECVAVTGFNCPFCMKLIHMFPSDKWRTISYGTSQERETAVESAILYSCNFCRTDFEITFYQTIRISSTYGTVEGKIKERTPLEKPKRKLVLGEE